MRSSAPFHVPSILLVTRSPSALRVPRLFNATDPKLHTPFHAATAIRPTRSLISQNEDIYGIKQHVQQVGLVFCIAQRSWLWCPSALTALSQINPHFFAFLTGDYRFLTGRNMPKVAHSFGKHSHQVKLCSLPSLLSIQNRTSNSSLKQDVQ